MIYFDNAATTFPKPESVIDAVVSFMKNKGANPGRSGHRMALDSARVVFDVRMELAGLFGISNPMDIAFAKNATEALNFGICGFLKSGDHVISTMMEHNSVSRPIVALQERGVEHTFCPCDEEGFLDLEAFERSFKKNTALVAITHASNITGSLNDLFVIGQICKEKGVPLLVDAAQSAGIFPIDVESMNISMLCAPGHKGLYGPMGTGFIYVKEGISLKPLLFGGTGSVSESLSHPQMMPDALEAGTVNAHGLAGLLAGVRFVRNKGLRYIQEYEQDLMSYFIRQISMLKQFKLYGSKDMKRRAAVVSFNIGSVSSTEISERLDIGYGIAVRSGLHCSSLGHQSLGTENQGVVRVSFSCFNTREEVDQLVAALKKIAGDLV